MAGKRALVTGGSRGIGRACAVTLAAAGADVAIGCSPAGVDAAKKVCDEILALGRRAELFPFDVGVAGEAEKMCTAVRETFDGVDILVNNAGITRDRSFKKMERAAWDEVINTNLNAVFEVTRQFIDGMAGRGWGRVINVSSGYGQLEGLSANVPSYCLSKLALNGLTIMLAEALRADSIAVNSMCPGWVRTDMGGPGADRSVKEGADTAVWLADEASHELTGKFFRDRQEIPW